MNFAKRGEYVSLLRKPKLAGSSDVIPHDIETRVDEGSNRDRMIHCSLRLYTHKGASLPTDVQALSHAILLQNAQFTYRSARVRAGRANSDPRKPCGKADSNMVFHRCWSGTISATSCYCDILQLVLNPLMHCQGRLLHEGLPTGHEGALVSSTKRAQQCTIGP